MPDLPNTQAPTPPLRLLGITVRLDATLCDPGEVWFEHPDGTVTLIVKTA